MASHYDADGPILRLHVMKPTDRSGGFYREWSKSHGKWAKFLPKVRFGSAFAERVRGSVGH